MSTASKIISLYQNWLNNMTPNLEDIEQLAQAIVDYYNNNNHKPYDLRLHNIIGMGLKDNQSEPTSITSFLNAINELNEDELAKVVNTTFPNPNESLDSLKDIFIKYHLDEIKRFVGWLEDKNSSLVHIQIALDEIKSSVCKLGEVILLDKEVF